MWSEQIERPLQELMGDVPGCKLPNIRTLESLSQVLAPSETIRFLAMTTQVVDGKVCSDLPDRLLCLTDYFLYFVNETEISRHALNELVDYSKGLRRDGIIITLKRVGKLAPLKFGIEGALEHNLSRFMKDDLPSAVNGGAFGQMTLSDLHLALQKVYVACADVAGLDGIKEIVTVEKLYVDAMITGYKEIVSILHQVCVVPNKFTKDDSQVPIVSSAGGMMAMTFREEINSLNRGKVWYGARVNADISTNRAYADDRSYLTATYWDYVRHLARKTENAETWNALVLAITDVMRLSAIYQRPSWNLAKFDEAFRPSRECEEFLRKWLILKPEEIHTFAISEMLE